MKQLNVEVPNKDKAVWETIINPEKLIEPAIRIRKNIEAVRFDADFALELKGVAEKQSRWSMIDATADKTSHADEAQVIGNLLSGLSMGQCLDFIYSFSKSDSGAGVIDWKIRGRVNGQTADSAATDARELYQNMVLVLATIQDRYQFGPVTEQQDLAAMDKKDQWIGTVSPLGIDISAAERGRIGFGTTELLQSQANSVIAVPYRKQNTINPIDSVAVAATSCLADMKIRISINPVLLSTDELKHVGSALDWLQNGEAKKLLYPQETNTGLDDKDIMTGLEHTLNNWIKNPYGYRISCTVSSDRPIPASLMSMSAGLFNCPVMIRTSSTGRQKVAADSLKTSEKNKSNVLDLQGCCNSSNDMPSMIPTVNALTICGTDKIYQTALNIPVRSGLLLGETVDRSLIKDVRFSRPDRSRHAYCLGATGVGKSTLLYNMIMQDIENGEGVTLIDPHGDLFTQVLSSIPKERADDLIIFDPTDFNYSVGLNFLECTDFYKPVQMNYVINELIMIFDRLYDLRETGGPIFEQYMRNSLALILDNDLGEQGTLVDLPSVFEDRGYRRHLLRNCKNRLVIDFWTKMAERASGDAQLSNVAPYITSKLNQFTHNAIIRPIIGQKKSTINFREVMDKRRILLINLSKGMLGNFDSRLLGMLLIGKLFGAALSRANQKHEDRKPMFFYIDEFQNFATEGITHILSEARKYSLFLTLANQNLAQLNTSRGNNILDSVLGNVGSLMLMRTGSIDAAKMETYTKPALLQQDLQELPDFHVVGRLLSNNTPTKPFVFKTMPMRKVEDAANVEMLRYSSRKRYARPTQDVESEIMSARLESSPLEKVLTEDD
ncbi:MAG: type IV secretion system DNA-binding domain-containing protein [Nitrospirae bacterium]|nr:type IV secretion system DNA-binding domain-containing protein [Nitrospirota bacterium]